MNQIKLLHHLKTSGFLLAVGEDEAGHHPYLKVFDLDTIDKSGAPTLVR